ncbi:MAG TPA: hypothetical protein VI306_25680 [Pyrinomonadaceae bacterium]
MQVNLKALNFNHQKNSATNDAFSLRRNENVSLSDWSPAAQIPQESPAAYARDQIKGAISIQAQFSCDDLAVPTIWIRALDANSGSTPNVLGTVSATEVPLARGTSNLIPLTLTNVRIPDVGVSASNVIWRWQFSLNPNNPQSWANVITSPIGTSAVRNTTTHRIYTVLDLPGNPWQSTATRSSNIQIPWTEVLEVACAWAAGAQDVDAAAGLITERVNGLGNNQAVVYDFGSSCILHGTDNFLLRKFLTFISSPPHTRNKMNCSDCATAVSVFSNILGARLSQSAMGSNFYFNHLETIGSQQPGRGKFQRHEVAWTGACTKDDRVFDASVLLDGEGNPDTDRFVPLLAKNMLFGTPDDDHYQFRLAGRKSFGGLCEADPGAKKFRLIGTEVLVRRLVSANELAALEESYNFASWKSARSGENPRFIFGSLAKSIDVRGWRLLSTTDFVVAEGMPPTSELLWGSEEDSNESIIVNVYECDSLESSHEFLLAILGEADAAYIKREDPDASTTFGDIAFTDLEGFLMLFARANFVVVAKRVGSARTDLAKFLHSLDAGLMFKPDLDRGDMDRFRFAEGSFFVDDLVPIQFVADPAADRLGYKFFAALGDVFRREDHLFYKPESNGPQTVVVFEIDSQGEVRKQELYIEIGERNSFKNAQYSKTRSVKSIGEKVMAHKLEGQWRSFEIDIHDLPDQTPPTCTNDDKIYLNIIHPVTGIIVDGFHLIGSSALRIEGVVIPTGSSFSIVMEHDEYRNEEQRTRRYQGTVCYEDDDHLVIFAKTFTRPKGTFDPLMMDPRNPQDDATVIIVRP